MPQFLVSLHEGGDVAHELHDSVITIGRISENTLQIEDVSVSSRHAQLTLDEGGDFILRDLGSTNGTELNGKPIEPETDHPLQDGDKVRFGKIDATYKSENPAEARPLPEAEEVAAVVAETSARPADFANASPFQTKKKKKDPVGLVLIVLAVLALGAFGYAVSLIYAIEPPQLQGNSPPPAMLPTIRCERRTLPKVAAEPRAENWRGLHIHTLRDTVTGAPPRQATAVKAAWDAAEFRVLFEIADDHIIGTQTQRDGPIWEEEVAEVFIDPVGDLASYFEFEVNPINTVLDLVVRKNRSGYAKDTAWRCEGLRTAVARQPQGWSAEFAFPFRSLIAELPTVGTRWRINFCRIDRPPGVERELSAWSPTGRANFHTPERFGFLEFVA